MRTREVTQKCPSTISAPATSIREKVQTGGTDRCRCHSENQGLSQGSVGTWSSAGPQKQQARIGRCGHRGIWPPGEEKKAPELI